jgi:hypothetical protein
VNDQDILTCASQSAEWLFDRREHLEKHEHESLTQRRIRSHAWVQQEGVPVTDEIGGGEL